MKKPRRRIIRLEYYCKHFMVGKENMIKVLARGNAIKYEEKICVFCGMVMCRKLIWNRPEDKV